MIYQKGSCVYVVRALATSRYKIGIAGDLEMRLSALQSDSPLTIKVVVVHYCNANRSLERRLHAHFANKRHHGEWFDLAPEDIAFLRMHTETLLGALDIEPEDWVRWRKHPVTQRDLSPDQPDEAGEIKEIVKKPKKHKEKEVAEVVVSESITGLAKELNDLYEELGTWSKVGALYGVSRTVVWRIAKKGYEPTRRSPETRRKLGLSRIEIREVHRNSLGRYSERS